MAHILFEQRDWNDGWRRTTIVTRGSDADPGGVECVPPLDIVETAEAIEVILDLPGVPPDAVSVVVQDGTLLVSGTKRPAHCRSQAAAFHLAERTFGGFSRSVRLADAVDASRATVTLVAGELRIVLPRIDERRGRPLRLTVAGA